MNTDEIGALLQDKKKLLSETYFELQAACEEVYGPDTLVIIEVGSFFEVYEVNNESMKIGKAKEVAEFLNIQLTRKNKTILEQPFYTKSTFSRCSYCLDRALSQPSGAVKKIHDCPRTAAGRSPSYPPIYLQHHLTGYEF
ncbi:MAG: hypothetical protein Q7T91_03720 [Sulfuricurvum sp.]|nr:hypothetical protein [Sulfuricurvum sp.]